jgi:microcystin-dependent protein
VLGVSQSHDLGSTGGEAAHTLTESELPVHSHVVPAHSHADDIEATTPALSHTITQPVFKYVRSNSSGTKYYRYGSAVNNSAGNASGSRSANAAVAKHDPVDCTVSGTIDECAAMVSSTAGNDGSHNNMQPYLVTNYIISVGA